MPVRLGSAIAAVVVLLEGVAACTPAAVDDAVSSEDAIQTTSGGTGKRPISDGPMLVPIAAEGAATSSAAGGSNVWVDDVVCAIDRKSLETGVDGRGWTLLVDARCPEQVTIAVNGVSDAPYPQVDVTTALGRDAVALQKAGIGDGPDTFTTGLAGGAVSITAGPSNADRAPVTGSAIVVDGAGASHSVAVDVKF